MTTLAVLGSTGSIGRQTLDVVAAHPDRLKVVGIAARTASVLAQQARAFQVPMVGLVVSDGGQDHGAAATAADFPAGTAVLHGADALVTLATHPDVDIVVVATVGRAALEATLAAVRAGKRVAIANKEVLVMAGAVITAEARAGGATLLPIDSEHSALWQCLLGEERGGVAELILTASGGALRDYEASQLDAITPEQALRHPTWIMGPKVTIDSATLMNKGLEVLEARWLFDVPIERVRILLHPTSTVHSLVRFVDGTLKAQIGAPDMREPIQFALSYPERWPLHNPRAFELETTPPLAFQPLPPGRYPCLDLALRAGHAGGTYPAALCAADEVAVDLFLAGKIKLPRIATLVEGVLDGHASGSETDIEAIVDADRWARLECRRLAAVR